MEHLEDTSRLLQEPSWAAKIEIEEVLSSVSPRLDKEGPRLARIQDKYQEDFRVSSSVSDLPGRSTRSKVLNPQPSSRQDLMDEDLVFAMLGKQKVSRADLEGLIGLGFFVFGYPHREDVCYLAYCRDERAPVYVCSSCQSIFFTLSVKAFGAFLLSNFLS